MSSQSKDFLKEVKASWSEPIKCTCMYQLVRKLKRLKPVLKQLNRHQFPDIQQQMQQVMVSLQQIQERVGQNPTDESLQKREREEYKNYIAVCKAHESFIYQKAKEFWNKQSDSNSSFFHAKMRIRTMKNRILSFVNTEEELVSDWKLVAKHFVGFYQAQLGQTSVREEADPTVFNQGPILDWKKQLLLVKQVSQKEIKRALWDIHSCKSPGPDRFGSGFYKDAWAVVKEDVTKAVMEFLETGELLKQKYFVEGERMF
ncbi:OLC1v1026336C1 [Oldenlandia corymbosa var. corymbosa]|uniref:OLC1v1026336C1 n=1 Tax=Oldenlandia corymbosa var. corymbosa TaxID=529605 RepID=A0AAV1C944_OLDCO|nr:OLC1v1026336C1 [Oldenlandia corymbosa var. corymbosa]